MPSRVRNNNQESQVTTQSSSTTTTESKSAEVTTTRARGVPVRNRNLFNTANRRVPLNRFRGRQRVAKPQEPEEQIEIQLEIEEERKAAEIVPEEVEPQVSSTESSRATNSFLDRLRAQRERRPRPNIRSRPLSASRRPAFALRRRKPVDEGQAEDQVQDQGDQALLVCSEGKCFDPSTKKEIKQSKKPKKLSKEVMRLLEEMKILEAEEATEEKKQNHIALLLEAAKVRTRPSRILKTNDLIEMLRSSGALFDDPDSAVDKKEVMETIEVAEEFLEEEIGVEEMIREEVKKLEEEITTIKPLEELEEPVTTLPDIPEDLESAEGGLSMTLEVVQEEPEVVQEEPEEVPEATDAPMISESVEEEELEELLEEYDDDEEVTTFSPVEEKVVDTFVVQASVDDQEEEVFEEIEVGVHEMEKAEVRQEVVEPLVVPVSVKPNCDDDAEVVTEQEETEEVEQEVEQELKEVSVE